MAHTTKPPTPPSPLILAEPDTSPGPFEGPEKLLEVWFAPSPELLPGANGGNGTCEPLNGTANAHGHGPYGHMGAANGAAACNCGNSTNGNMNGHSNGSAMTTPATGRGGRMGESPSGEPFRGLRTVPRAVWEEMLDIVKCKVLSVVEGDEIDAYLLSESSLFVAPHVIILKTCGTTLNLLGLHRILEIAQEYCGLNSVWRCFYSRKSFFFPERQQGPHRDWTDEVRFLDNVFGTSGSAYTVGPINRDHWLLYLTTPNAVSFAPCCRAQRTVGLPAAPAAPPHQDQTLEILMSHLTPAGREPFFIPESEAESSTPRSGHELGAGISAQLGIDALFPAHETTLDSFGFEPCGYSANAVIGSGLGSNGSDGGYFTIHVTPEDGWSYASFESNVPLPAVGTPGGRPDLKSLIRRVVDIFQPNRLSITLFVSTGEDHAPAPAVLGGELLPEFERKDRIGYEFDGYDLIFGCFERKGWTEPRSPTSAAAATLKSLS